MKTILSQAFVAVTSRYPQIRFTKYQFNFWRSTKRCERMREGEKHTEIPREAEGAQAEGPLVVRPDFQSELIKSRADHANLFNFIL